eukprot:62513-Pleurochrysis_carterae.AAC.1
MGQRASAAKRTAVSVSRCKGRAVGPGASTDGGSTARTAEGAAARGAVGAVSKKGSAARAAGIVP